MELETGREKTGERAEPERKAIQREEAINRAIEELIEKPKREGRPPFSPEETRKAAWLLWMKGRGMLDGEKDASKALQETSEEARAAAEEIDALFKQGRIHELADSMPDATNMPSDEIVDPLERIRKRLREYMGGYEPSEAAPEKEEGYYQTIPDDSRHPAFWFYEILAERRPDLMVRHRRARDERGREMPGFDVFIPKANRPECEEIYGKISGFPEITALGKAYRGDIEAANFYSTSARARGAIDQQTRSEILAFAIWQAAEYVERELEDHVKAGELYEEFGNLTRSGIEPISPEKIRKIFERSFDKIEKPQEFSGTGA